MRVPLSWLAEYVDLAPGTTPEDVHAALVKVGFEEEDIHRSDVTGPVVVGEVVEFVEEPQSNGKSIRWCQVRVAKPGEKAADAAFGGTGDEVRGIVCGAKNFAVGDKVIVTLPGAVLPGGFAITPRKTYGHTSDGMMASAKELGLGDDHSGILVWSTLGLDPEIGTDAAGLLGLDDSAVEINVTPDRGYAFSIRGVAREYAHATGATFRDPAQHLPVTGGAHSADAFATDFSVTIDDAAPIRDRAGASVFVTRVVTGVDATRPTPGWMSSRLRLAGVRPISLVVDITNYVMFELGQPIHGYDLDKVTGGLTVRRALTAAAGRVDPKGRIETLTTLDEQVRTLHAEDLVIADSSGAIGLAGVMGGASTEITSATTNVLIEAANFDPVSIARSARRHKLPSEASRRFERGVDPAVAEVAAGRVVQLLVDLAGGVVADHGSYVVGRVDPKGRIETTTGSMSDWFDREPIELPDGFVSGLIGYDYTPEQVRSSLAEIGGQIAEAKGALMVTPPSWRPDITDKWTLAEEVARIVGFDVIPAMLPVAPPGRGYTVAQQVRRRVSNGLASAGHTETLAYPFFDEATNNLVGSAAGGEVPQVRLANALDSEQGWMRTSLLPGLMQTAARNRSRGVTDLAIFEQGLVFRPEAGVTYGHAMLPAGTRPTDSQIAELNASIPPQPRHIAGVLVGDAVLREPGQKAVSFDWQDALSAVEQIASAAGVHIVVSQATHASFHPGRCAALTLRSSSSAEGASGRSSSSAEGAYRDVVIGYAGEILPTVADAFNLSGRVAAYELDLDAIAAAAGEPVSAEPVHTMTAATQDVSLVVETEIPAADVEAALIEGAGQLLEHARLVDIYQGEGLPAGTRSLTFALRFRAPNRTLTQVEATEAKQAGVALAAERFGAAIRD